MHNNHVVFDLVFCLSFIPIHVHSSSCWHGDVVSVPVFNDVFGSQLDITLLPCSNYIPCGKIHVHGMYDCSIVHVNIIILMLMRDVKEEERSKQGQTNNKAKQHMYMYIVCVCYD